MLPESTPSQQSAPSSKRFANSERFSVDPAAHPYTLYEKAGEYMEAGDMREAGFWFYAGQLRYRIHLAARPDLPRDEDPALFASLNMVFGQPINGYLGGDPEMWENLIGEVLEWDEQMPNRFTPKDTYAEIHRKQREGLKEMQDWIHDNHDEIREKRAANKSR